MKKFPNYRIFLIFILAVTAGCGSAAVDPQSTPPLQQASQTNTPLVEEIDGPRHSVATCRALESEQDDYTYESDWIKGAEDYTVTVIEYGDYQCPECANFARVITQLMQDFPEDVRFIYRHFPLLVDADGEAIHDKAGIAMSAAEAAGIQDMFWEMHDLLYAKQDEWENLTPEDFKDWVTNEAQQLGLDMDLFVPDLNSDTIARYVEDSFAYGVEFGIPGTPFILIDNRPLDQQYYSYTALNVVMNQWPIPLGRLDKRNFDACPEMTIDEDARYTATIKTEKGDIVIALYSDIAPFAVNNFIFLAENDFYDNVSFHRVIEGFVAQGGDPSGTGAGNAGYFFTVEASQEVIFDRPGLVSYANADPTTNSSQFFITFRAAPELNGKFTIFGEVIEGMDVALSLTLRDPQQGPDLPEGDLILDIEIHRND